MKKRANVFWRAIFILLLIINLGFGYWIFLIVFSGSPKGLGFIELAPSLLLVLAASDLIITLSYILTQRPKGVARVISYAALIPATLLLLYAVRVVYSLWMNPPPLPAA
jgi:hypothetical protein